VKPPFSYYGGKSRLAEWLVSLMPPHRVYVEPFAGSGAVLFAKRPSVHEVLNDANGDIVAFFTVLRDRPQDLERACRLTPYSRAAFESAAADRAAGVGLDDLERARRWWLFVSQSFAKAGAPNSGWSTSIQRGSNNARSAQNTVDRFMAAAARLAEVTIECRDAVDVIRMYGAPDGVMYVDPPYLGSTRTSIAGGRRPAGDYVCEFHHEDDHRRLAEALHETPSTVFLSGYPSPLYDELYDAWYRVERTVVRRTTNGRSGSNTHVQEVVWSNQPIRDVPSLFADVEEPARV
jgi:DNA adenine methylase